MSKVTFNKANELFVDEEYEQALNYYTQAIKEDSYSSDYYEKRAQCFIKLEKYKEAFEDANKSILINKNNHLGHLRKGIANFKLGDFKNAKLSFKEGLSVNKDHKQLKNWYKKTLDKLGEKEEEIKEVKIEHKQIEEVKNDIKEDKKEVKEDKKEEKKDSIRHDWYQLGDEVVVSVVLKNVKKNELEVKIEKEFASVRVNRDGKIEEKSFNLSNEIIPEESSFNIYSSNIELTLKKKEEIEWTVLEKGEEKIEITKVQNKDWDLIGKQIDEETKDDGDGLQKLFQSIYSNGDDNLKKAMMKSFSESGGTVLSTNWNEVSKSKVEPKLRKDEELKKW